MKTDNEKIIEWIEEYQKSTGADVKKKLAGLVFLAYRPYVKSLVRSFARRSNDPYDDFFQVASIGVIKAMDTFDKNVNENFKTYVTQIVMGQIRHYLRDKTTIIRAPRSMRELSYRIHKITTELTERLGIEPTNDEIARELRVSGGKVQEAINLERRTTPVSIEQLNLIDDGHLQDNITKSALEEYRKMLYDFDNQIILNDALKRLDKTSSQLITLSFFDELNYSQIGQRLNMNSMTVSRKIKKALNVLFDILMEREIKPTTSKNAKKYPIRKAEKNGK